MSAKLVDTMMQMGMSRGVASLALPMMWVTPSIADRYSPSTISIVRGLQRHYGMPDTGQVCTTLDAKLAACCGKSWRGLTWAHIYDAVLRGGTAPSREITMSGYAPVGGFLTDWAANYKQAMDRILSGTAKPTTAPELANFKAIQNTANRIAERKGLAKIGVDGRIGPKTTALVNRCLGSTFSANDIADRAASVLADLLTLANNIGAPATVSAPAPKSPPSVARTDGTVAHPPGAGGGPLAQLASFIGTPTGLVVVIGGVALLTQTKKGKKMLKDVGL
jgi:hypothetical protein